MSSVTNAEGGGWGVEISASVGLMQSSSMSQKSITMTIGSGITLYRDTVRLIETVPLNNASRSLLQRDPDLWVNTYGIHYVSEVVYGASFMGY